MSKKELPVVTRAQLPNGKYRYWVNGEVEVKGANRRYEFVSVYSNTEGKPVVWFHARRDLALKGNATGNYLVVAEGWSRIGVAEINVAAGQWAGGES